MSSNTPLPHLCNKEFVCEIESLCERNVLILLLDGSAVFGRISRIDDCIISVVPAIGIAGLGFVQIVPPNSDFDFLPFLVSQTLIDMCNVAHIVEGPFIVSPLVALLDQARSAQEQQSQEERKEFIRPQRELLYELGDLQGQNLGIVTLGGWMIFGVLGWVENCVCVISPSTANTIPYLTIGAITIAGPAFDDGLIRLFGTFRVRTNLKALTQVILP